MFACLKVRGTVPLVIELLLLLITVVLLMEALTRVAMLAGTLILTARRDTGRFVVFGGFGEVMFTLTLLLTPVFAVAAGRVGVKGVDVTCVELVSTE